MANRQFIPLRPQFAALGQTKIHERVEALVVGRLDQVFHAVRDEMSGPEELGAAGVLVLHLRRTSQNGHLIASNISILFETWKR